MPQRIQCFLVVFMLMFSLGAFSQENKPVLPAFSLRKALIYKNDSLKISRVQPDFYTKNLTFFCKKELQIEKATNVPLRFRLGSLEYTNYLERKPNAVKP
jgi:hypothetical protein